MKPELQIFTGLQRQKAPVDKATLLDLEKVTIAESPKKLPLSSDEIEIHGYPFTVELAKTRHEKAKGLSGRRHVPNGTGMLFFMNGGPAKFHMKNTHVPLDILFLDKNGTVIEQSQMQPYTGKSSCSKDVHYALELPMGTCQSIDVKVGDTFDLGKNSLIRSAIREVLLSM